MTMMQISDDGLSALAEREGIRLEAYRDTRGIVTCGIGHTAAAGPPIPHMGDVWTREQVLAVFKADTAQFAFDLNALIKVPVNQQEFDALASLAFNIGDGTKGFAGSSVLHRLNAGDVEGAADAFLMWEDPPALKERRIAERAQFLSGGLSPRQGAPVAAPSVGSTLWVQSSLNALGASPVLILDGVYGGAGSATRQAVREFQINHGCVMDGIAGPATVAAIQDALDRKG